MYNEEGKSHGIEYHYYDNGKIMREVFNQNGKWIYIKTFEYDGTLFSIQDHENGFVRF